MAGFTDAEVYATVSYQSPLSHYDLYAFLGNMLTVCPTYPIIMNEKCEVEIAYTYDQFDHELKEKAQGRTALAKDKAEVERAVEVMIRGMEVETIRSQIAQKVKSQSASKMHNYHIGIGYMLSGHTKSDCQEAEELILKSRNMKKILGLAGKKLADVTLSSTPNLKSLISRIKS